MTELVMAEITSDDPRAVAIKLALHRALDIALDDAKLEGEIRHMLTTVAVTAFLWECGQRDGNIPPVAIGALMNMAVDAGLAERIGMQRMAGPDDVLQ